MKNKGFTLTELLGVVAIMSIIAMVIIPIVSGTIYKSKKDVRQIQVNKIIDGAYNWTLEHIDQISNDGTTFIALGQLKIWGYIDQDVVDPITFEQFQDDLIIGIKYDPEKRKTLSEDGQRRGKYVFDFMNSKLTYPPEIIVEGYTKSNDGTYNISMDVSQESGSLDLNVTAKSENNNDYTDDLFSYIEYNDGIADSVDKTKPGLYKIHYILVTDEGYSDSIIVNVVINDKELPVLAIDGDLTVDKGSVLDLLMGVTCTDNSGHCSITTQGDVDINKLGNYTVKYFGKDMSGNTVSMSRIVTVKEGLPENPPENPPATSNPIVVSAPVPEGWMNGSLYVSYMTIDLTNTSINTVNSWTVTVDLPSGASISNVSNANMTKNGNTYTFTNMDYNGTINPNQSVQVGFQLETPVKLSSLTFR